MVYLYGSLFPKPFPVEASYLVGALWFVIPAIMIFGFRRKRTDYGLTLSNCRKNLDLVLSSFPYYVITFAGFSVLLVVGWSYIEPMGAMFMTGIFLLVLVLITDLIGKKYSAFEAMSISDEKHRSNLILLVILLTLPIVLGLILGRFSLLLVSTIFWQFFFSGFGEEIFFRGYIQSRLNAAFGRPYQLRGIRFGIGLFIAAGIFSVTHMLNFGSIWFGDFELLWWWGTFTFVGGLLFGLLREKTGSILAPGMLHGLEAVGEGLAFLI